MKHYFKYKFGYINIDDENLYLTKTGNWQEVRDIKENITTQEKEPSERNKEFYWWLFTIEIISLIYIITTHFELIIMHLLFILVMNSVVYIFHKREFGKQAIIPLEKIEYIEIYNENSLKIHFQNSKNELNKEKLKKVEGKGVDFLTGLNIKS